MVAGDDGNNRWSLVTTVYVLQLSDEPAKNTTLCQGHCTNALCDKKINHRLYTPLMGAFVHKGIVHPH